MDSVNTAIEKFKEILNNKPSWVALKYSQFIEHLAIFTSWALRSAQFSVERTKQEFFISSALNRASIAAHAEDRDYLPRKPIPSIGIVTINNIGLASITIPIYTEFTSENDIVCRIKSAIVIAPESSETVEVEQGIKEESFYDVTEEKVFFEALLSIEKTKTISSMEVYVNENDGLGFKKYEYARLLQNTNSDSRVYDEFYAHTEQIGIRFGNGIFGYIPPLDSIIQINTISTGGDVFLSEGQEFFPVDDILDSNNEIAVVEIKVSTAVSGGHSAEETEEIRKNLLYWTTYDEKLVWDADYVFFLKRVFPDILFSKAWGEQKAEEMAGAPSLDFINKIFICAYAEDSATLEDDCLDALNDVKVLNRNFEWREPVQVQFTVSVTGKVLQDIVLSEAETAIKENLELYYGQNSENRRAEVFSSEVYDAIQETGYFTISSGAKFDIVLAGQYEAGFIYEMVSIDLDNSTFDISYV